MAQGERVFTTSGRKVTQYDRTPPKPGDYTLLIKGTAAQAGKRDEPDAKPYVYVPVEIKGTAPEEGGRNKQVSLYLDTDLAADGSGQAAIDKPGGLTDLGMALGESIAAGMTTFNFVDKDGNAKECDIVDPTALKDWLVARGDFEVRGRIKVRPGNAKRGTEPRGIIAQFYPSQGPTTDSMFG